FKNNKLPLMPLAGVGNELFDDAREIGLENQIPKFAKIIKPDFKESVKISEKEVKKALKTKKKVSVTVGPN
ncbi:MAG: thiamine biosynthesis protein, partial [Candidatus Dadabacteria bacterium]|nr:thiamine biosynthesis protein [Candidatus Dadabacteria bacterium]